MTEVKYRRRKHLTQEEKIRIVTDYNAGLPVIEIRRRYDCSHNTVYRVLREMATQ